MGLKALLAAEYMVNMQAAKEAIWMVKLMMDLGRRQQ
jgi:hypothetical protein